MFIEVQANGKRTGFIFFDLKDTHQAIAVVAVAVGGVRCQRLRQIAVTSR